jgi:hypothetical protein
MTEDFNVALEEGGTNRGINNEPLTAELLHTILIDNCLVDIRMKTNNRTHTYYRKDNWATHQGLTTSLATSTHSIIFSIFDHSYVEETPNKSLQHRLMTIKDFILGSDEFLIHS